MAPDPQRLRDLTPEQRKTGLAAWLGWLFDGLDMHIYGLVATAFVAILIFRADFAETIHTYDGNNDGVVTQAEWAARESGPFEKVDRNGDGRLSVSEMEVYLAASKTAADEVKEKSSWIQAAFLVGWALGGTIFGRIGDILGRSRTLSLTVLTYAAFTGLSFFAQTWWQLLIFRFVAALGIGGEWAVGSTLLSETWPKRWRPWTAAVLQTGVNIGVILACIAGALLAGQHPKWIFLIGVLPAVLVYYIRRHVPEPEAWTAAKTGAKPPGAWALFSRDNIQTTLTSIGICAFSLTAWWAFLFWHIQHVRALPEVTAMSAAARDSLIVTLFGWVTGISIIGNFAAGLFARLFGFKSALVIMFIGFGATMAGAFRVPHSLEALTHFWLPAVGFWSGVFGLFTMLLPPLFPTLLRTTGAGFCYNIGRIAAAAGTIFAAQITQHGDFRQTLLYTSFLFIPAILFTLLLPASRHDH